MKNHLSLAFLFVVLFARTARSAEISGPPIEDNNYRLDLRQGPIIGSAKQVALGGAYIGLAEGIMALNSNPAGVAFRTARSKKKFDWDWTAGVNDLKSNDFDNNGFSPPNYAGHRIRSLGIMGQYGAWGVGILSNGELLKLENSSNPDDEYVLNATSFALGRQLMDEQLTLGIGLRATIIKLRTTSFDATLGKISGVGWDVGGIWNPKHSGFRFGASFASSIRSAQSLNTTSTSPVTVNGLIIPSDATLPWQFGVGASYRSKSAPFWKSRPWLLAGDLVFIGASDNAVGVESVLAQKKQTVGAETTLSVRIGTEVEALPGRLRLRLGSYYEPSFYSSSDSRTHLTGGAELRLFHTRIWGEYDWGFTYTIDSARDYLNNFVSIGFWYY
ncbi:MAG: hypothetical protein KCHDKBKB_01323 [Elusimicrobia bacterium]|nr:hypothetical protein [Elusimicrobiota bacterium]